jgi:hypothetical protein
LDDSNNKYSLHRLHKVFKKHEGRNNWYAGQFFFCELLNLGNVAGNIYLVDWFLSGSFLDYGKLVVQVNLISPSPAATVAGSMQTE